MLLLGLYACHANKSVDPARVMFDISFIDRLVIHADFGNRFLRLKRSVTHAVRLTNTRAFDADFDFSPIDKPWYSVRQRYPGLITGDILQPLHRL